MHRILECNISLGRDFGDDLIHPLIEQESAPRDEWALKSLFKQLHPRIHWLILWGHSS